MDTLKSVHSSDLSLLSHGLSTTHPLGSRPSGYAIIVEERQEFLGEALEAAKLLQDDIRKPAPVVAVGVRRLPKHNLAGVYYAGVGTDAEKMQRLAGWVSEGRLGRDIVLLVPPHRAQWLNGLFQQKAWSDLRLRCNSQAWDMPTPGGVMGNPAEIIAQARLLIEAMNANQIDPIDEFMPGGEYRKAFERLTA